MENLIKSIFNININDIVKFETVNDDKDLIAHVRLKRKDGLVCPICANKLVSNGIKNKPINHKALVDRKNITDI